MIAQRFSWEYLVKNEMGKKIEVCEACHNQIADD
ncbi:hypothetical protein SAMN02746011_01619 [Globicatella sulfidifaciens DSM 15739]|uniref:Uncharacterized protein n=1 Tax=Globicatella sulfidifaciens DSM 15739 TaxID=1121925 RepID=A0A1T4N1S1_9LACT|nr:hypothetical protein SAMN02746011_01619 [Globicatella sulfidifaciens DSM 15739]